MNGSATGMRQLRPLSVTELIDATVTLYRENFALFAGVVAVLAIPQTLLSMIYVALLPPFSVSSSGNTLDNASTAVNAFSASAAHSGGTGLLGAIFSVFITGALAHAVAARYLGRPETISGAYTETGFQPFLRLFLALLLGIGAFIVFIIAMGLLVLLAVIGGSSATPIAVILGIVVTVIGLVVLCYVVPHFYLVPQVIILERRGVIDSLRRSWFLFHGYYWHVVGLILLLTLMVGIVSGIISGVVTLLTVGNPVLSTALNGVVSILLQPISLGAITLLYFDQRVRKEAFDLEYAAGQMAFTPQ
jgi:hypothetical protein